MLPGAPSQWGMAVPFQHSILVASAVRVMVLTWCYNLQSSSRSLMA